MTNCPSVDKADHCDAKDIDWFWVKDPCRTKRLSCTSQYILSIQVLIISIFQFLGCLEVQLDPVPVQIVGGISKILGDLFWDVDSLQKYENMCMLTHEIYHKHWLYLAFICIWYSCCKLMVPTHAQFIKKTTQQKPFQLLRRKTKGCMKSGRSPLSVCEFCSQNSILLNWFCLFSF